MAIALSLEMCLFTNLPSVEESDIIEVCAPGLVHMCLTSPFLDMTNHNCSAFAEHAQEELLFTISVRRRYR